MSKAFTSLHPVSCLVVLIILPLIISRCFLPWSASLEYSARQSYGVSRLSESRCLEGTTGAHQLSDYCILCTWHCSMYQFCEFIVSSMYALLNRGIAEFGIQAESRVSTLFWNPNWIFLVFLHVFDKLEGALFFRKSAIKSGNVNLFER